MLVHGELETTVRFSECFSLLINGGSFSMEPILLPFFGRNWNLHVMKRQGLDVFAGDPPRDYGAVFGFGCRLLIGVMFFPSFPFVGVMLFPSYVLGNASGEGGTFFVSLSLFSPLLSLSLLSSPSPSFLVSLPLFHFPSPSLFHLFFLCFRTLYSSLSLFLSLS